MSGRQRVAQLDVAAADHRPAAQTVTLRCQPQTVPNCLHNVVCEPLLCIQVINGRLPEQLLFSQVSGCTLPGFNCKKRPQLLQAVLDHIRMRWCACCQDRNSHTDALTYRRTHDCAFLALGEENMCKE